MKKALLILGLLMFGCSAMAQTVDGFFSGKDWGGFRDPYTPPNPSETTLPILPNYNGGNQDAMPAPLGSGLLVLTALGAGYAISKRRKEER